MTPMSDCLTVDILTSYFIDTESPDDNFIVHFVTGQLMPGYHHCDEMNYELVIWTPGIKAYVGVTLHCTVVVFRVSSRHSLMMMMMMMMMMMVMMVLLVMMR